MRILCVVTSVWFLTAGADCEALPLEAFENDFFVNKCRHIKERRQRRRPSIFL